LSEEIDHRPNNGDADRVRVAVGIVAEAFVESVKIVANIGD
jgi:hypothetical protein